MFGQTRAKKFDFENFSSEQLFQKLSSARMFRLTLVGITLGVPWAFKLPFPARLRGACLPRDRPKKPSALPAPRVFSADPRHLAPRRRAGKGNVSPLYSSSNPDRGRGIILARNTKRARLLVLPVSARVREIGLAPPGSADFANPHQKQASTVPKCF